MTSQGWNPTWSTELILKGLLSFMLEDTGTAGSILTTDAQKEAFALESGAANLKNSTFTELFPEIVEKIAEDAKKKREAAEAAAAAGGGGGSNSGGESGAAGNAEGSRAGNAATADTAAALDSWGGNALLMFAVAAFAYVVMHILEEVDSN